MACVTEAPLTLSGIYFIALHATEDTAYLKKVCRVER